MAIPSLEGFAAGEKVAASKITKHTKTAIEESVYYKPFCQLNQTTPQSVTTGTTVVRVTFQAVVDDTDSMADLANNRIVVKTAGLYRVTAQMNWPVNATGHRVIRLYVNGGTSRAEYATSGTLSFETRGQVTAYARASVGHEITCSIAQTSGGSLSTATTGSPCWLAAEWISL
ncbi:hypothetical protein PSH03_005403 [Micromonospora sp. PSH03]|uniref:hypothetical protein n=1 Tax=Micromonospora salmantinae TaxID=2911211 RepID=UPI001EE7C0D0|nr:hypothetical protein [Micromonospora salmantinae]MCG5459619.1 hypothetical protein [Micromonospora salmantinae]